MKYLITGIAGFVGSSLARVILADNPNAQIVGIDNFSFGYRERLADFIDKIEFIEGDIKDIKSYLGVRHFDSIVHCAAIAPLPECQRDSYAALNQNVAICGSICDFALSSGSRDIVFFSSGAIYESTNIFPTVETVPISTSLVYPTTKYIAELYFEAMCRAYDINVTAIRLFNLYGPHQDYFRKQPPLIGYLLSSIIRDQEALLFSTGEQCRDYVYIDDLVDLVLVSANRMKSLPGGGSFVSVNAGSGVPVSVNGIIKILEAVSGQALKIKRAPGGQYWDKYTELFDKKISLRHDVIGREVDKHTHASTQKAEDTFGWRARVTLKDGLSKCYLHAKQFIPG